MILQALTRYYEDLLAQGKIDAPGWVPAKISFALYLDETGELTQVVPTMEDVTKGKKTVRQPQTMALPAAVKRTVGIASNFLWDNSSYLLGIDQKGKPERSCTTQCWMVLIPPPLAQFWHFSTTGNRKTQWSTRPLPDSSTK